MRIPFKALILTTPAGLACAIFLATCLSQDGLLFRNLEEVAASNIVTQDVHDLTPGAPIERELSSGETHTYRIAFIEGQYLRALVRGEEINLLVTLREPGGEKVFERARNHRFRPELILALARHTGEHHLTVSAIGGKGLRGRYTIKIEELRNALPEDHQRVAAERLLAEGELLHNLGRAESCAKALEKFKEYLSNWRAIGGDGLGEAQTLNFMGMIHGGLGNSREALDFYKRALLLFRAGGDRLGEAESLSNMAVAHYALSELQTALNLFNQALPLQRETGDRQGEVATLDNIGSIHRARGEGLLALDYYNQTLPMWRTLRDRAGEAVTLNNIGMVYSDLGESQKALESYLQALPIKRQVYDRRGEATTLSNIGLIYHGMGEPQKALDYNQQAVPHRQFVEDNRGLAVTFRNLALAHSSLGNHQKALDYHRQALSIFRKTGDQRGEAQVLNSIGWIHNNLGDYQKALDCHTQALSVCRIVGDRREEALAHEGLGRVYGSWAAVRELDKSLEHYRQALVIQKAIKSPQGESQSLLGIARVERERGNLAEARASVEAAIEIIESLRARIAVQDLRATYLATKQDYYDFYIDLLMAMRRHPSAKGPSEEYDAAALAFHERRLARSLLDSLTEARAGARFLQQEVDPQLLDEEHTIRQRLNAKEAYRIQLLSGGRVQEQATAEKELNDLITQYQSIQARIRTASPRYAALTQPPPLTLREIQQQALDDGTLLLEYALGKERSFLWAVTRDSIAGFELPGREVIETVAQRVYDLLNVSPQRQRKRESELAAAELGRILLGPVINQLGRNRLLIVADGVLQYVPFAALPIPESGGAEKWKSGRRKTNPQVFTPLIVNHEIVNLPSASTLAALRWDLSSRRPATRTVAVLADPVLQAEDARVRQSGAGAKIETIGTPAPSVAGGAEIDDLVRSAGDAGVPSLVRLPYTRQEAEAILSLARNGKSLKALDFKASRATATSPELAEYRIVHFATHGLINSQRPQLSGIVLSLVNEQGHSQDGFLRAHDIYNMRLGADLVVLSACQTALGRQVKGEGLVGIVRGFMYAGVPRVIGSLWNVKDESTAEFMKRFYQRMLEEGLRPAAALRSAQISMRQEPRWKAPYYWAGFVLQGEWK